ncbi:MAG: type II toxin-antitoxin system RelE/ParE family toxin [Arcobacteraceae bacterium]|nr:type II toxin-antitoxin system RelE/ParE family toxin [Arcobacteraceae bacterium]
MKIEKKPKFIKALGNILKFIAKDKITAAKKFENELTHLIQNLVNSPYKFRASNYFDEKHYRDLVYQGYTIIYKIETDKILILEIFKWQER